MIKKVVHGLVFSLIPIILFYLMEGFEHNAFEEVRQLAQVYNIFLFEVFIMRCCVVRTSHSSAILSDGNQHYTFGI